MLPELETLDQSLAASEAQVADLRAGCEKQVIWAEGVAKTPVSVVFVHGFSASRGELWPLPDLIAKPLGANLFVTRLTGHGQDGAAMGQASMADWDRDVAEALRIGAALGDKVIVIGCSTGCTLVTTALARGIEGAAQVKGVVHVSPNFGMSHPVAQFLLQLPGIRRWGPLLIGKEQKFEELAADHARFWTLRYDTQAVFTMAETVRAAMASPIEGIQTPAYFAYCEADKVVSAKLTKRVMARWGGAVQADVLIQGPRDDKMGHVMAGDVLSPDQTAPLAARIVDWVRGL